MTERAMQWAYGPWPKSHLHLMNDEEGPVTACGRTLRLPDIGLGLNQALSTGCGARDASNGLTQFCKMRCGGRKEPTAHSEQGHRSAHRAWIAHMWSMREKTNTANGQLRT
eukprot:13217257-Heterocapsa_arctica.AAC.1